MNIDIIIKLLRSVSREDNLIGFEMIRKEYGHDLKNINNALLETNIRIHRQARKKYRLYRLKIDLTFSYVNLH